jgi:hypothetical protein
MRRFSAPVHTGAVQFGAAVRREATLGFIAAAAAAVVGLWIGGRARYDRRDDAARAGSRGETGGGGSAASAKRVQYTTMGNSGCTVDDNAGRRAYPPLDRNGVVIDRTRRKTP